MVRYLMAALVASALSATSVARITPFPKTFHTQMVQANGTSLYVRIGEKGPAVVLLHGFGDTGDMWGPLAADLVKDHTVITREHYAKLYARPRAMHDAFEQFGAFGQDAIDNKALLATGGKLKMPTLALGAQKSFGLGMAEDLRFVASDVTGGIVPDSGHWIMEENPQSTVRLVTEFLRK